MEDAGIDTASLRVTEVLDEDDAKRLSFIGSPTIRIRGMDVDSPPDGEPSAQFGLTCRIYRRDDGRASPLPDGEQVRRALENAIDGKEKVR